MQVKKIIAVLLTVCLLFSLSVPAYAVDEVYNIADDVAPAPVIYYTEGYYPGAVADMRNAGMFANRIAHGSFSSYNYNPHWIYRQGHDALGYEYFTGDFNALTPFVTADQSDVSGIYMVDKTTLLSGNMLIFYLPSTADSYFDFQSSNFIFDQQSPQANTFYIDGDLTFSLRNLWSISGTQGSDSFYLASDPLAVQLVIDGKPYGDIIDVTGYTSPFTALYNGGIPTNATVTFNNLKVYYQGDTPDMIGFRVYTGSSFTDGQYTYNNAGDFVGVDVENFVTLRCSEIPDITFVQEGGDGYAGDLSGISGLLNAISGKLSDISTQLAPGLNPVYTQLDSIFSRLTAFSGWDYLTAGGSVATLTGNTSLSYLVRSGFLGLRSLMVDSSGVSYFSRISSFLSNQNANGLDFLGPLGNLSSTTGTLSLLNVNRVGFLGLAQKLTDLLSTQSDSGVEFLSPLGAVSTTTGRLSILNTARVGFLGLAKLSRDAQSYVADTVFPWQSFNMQTHQLNASTNITGQNNLFLTAFQSMEDKLGRLAYVFGSDEDLALKDSADPGTDAFRDNFGGGLSLGQIKDGADVVKGVSGLFDSGYDFGDAFTEISGNAGFFAWFTPENVAALDSTGSVMVLDDSDPYNMQIYYDRFQTVKEKREAGDD